MTDADNREAGADGAGVASGDGDPAATGHAKGHRKAKVRPFAMKSGTAGAGEPDVADAAGAPPGTPTPAPEAAAAPAAEGETDSADQVQRDAEALENQLLRLRADFENYRRRTTRERDEFCRRANEELAAELLLPIDNLERALRSAAEHGADDPFVQGFRLVAEQLAGVLAKFGVAPIATEGQTFDPAVHEAVSHLPSEAAPDGVIIAETRRGYTMGGRLLRAAQVVVSSGAAPGAAGDGA